MNERKLASLCPPAVKGDGILEEWVQIYNNTGSDIANGAIKRISYLVDTGTVSADATTALPLIVAVPLAPATEDTESNIIGIVDNPQETVYSTSPISKYDGIKSASLGWLKLKGVVKALCNGGTNDLAIGDQLEVIDAGTAFTRAVAASAGASGALADESVAIALEAYTSGTEIVKWVHLIGRRCSIKSS